MYVQTAYIFKQLIYKLKSKLNIWTYITFFLLLQVTFGMLEFLFPTNSWRTSISCIPLDVASSPNLHGRLQLLSGQRVIGNAQLRSRISFQRPLGCVQDIRSTENDISFYWVILKTGNDIWFGISKSNLGRDCRYG